MISFIVVLSLGIGWLGGVTLGFVIGIDFERGKRR
jgi:hypothetical protein